MTRTTRYTAGTARRATATALTLATLLGGLAGTARAAAPAAAEGRAAHSEVTQRQSGGWTAPLASRYRVSQKYGIRGNWSAGHHTGVDFATPTGTPVRSVGSGTVVFAGTSGEYGKAVTVRMKDGTYTLFAHLSAVGVRKGGSVRPGTHVGKSGNTGRSNGPHLHFEARAQRGYGSDVDPVAYMAKRGVRIA